MYVCFHEPETGDLAEQQNKALQQVLDAVNGKTLLDGRFIKYQNFFLDTENDLAPVGLLSVVNSFFLKQYQEDRDSVDLFTKNGE